MSHPYKSRHRGHLGTPGKFFVFILLVTLLVLGAACLVMYLWNAILPEVVGVRQLQFGQALGLLILSRLLFGGFHWARRGGEAMHRNRSFWREKWMHLSDEERQAFQDRWKDRCSTRKTP